MAETERIASQLRRLYSGPSWVGPTVAGFLSDVSNEAANRKPFRSAHSIAELTAHLTGWLRIARERLSATSPRDANEEENWPSRLPDWDDARKALKDEVTLLEQAIRSFSDSRLGDSAPAAEPQTFYELLHGVIQHTAYHAGQIALLKKSE